MVLARILSPADYGINAMAVAITGFAGVFSNLGLSTATVQRSEISHEQVSALFWINVGLGLLITLVIASLSPVVAWFYKTPEMTWVMLALSSTFFIGGLSAQHTALLSRQMKFYSLAKIQIISLIVGIVVAIVAAKHGFGYWSLVFNTLTNVIVTTVGSWMACRWVPRLPQRKVNINSIVKFGTDIMGFNVINYFSRNLDNVLIGRYHGSGALGLYSKAYQLLMMPITNLRDPMNSVAMPALSRLQNDSMKYCEYYMKFVGILAFISMPLVVFMFVLSENIIFLVLGNQWLDSILIFQILALVSFIQPISSTRGLVLLTVGRSRKYFLLGMYSACLVSLAFFIGIPWGPKGVAISYAVSVYLSLIPFLYFSFSGTPVSVKSFFISILKPTISSIFMGIAIFLFKKNLTELSHLLQLVITFPLSIVIYLLINATFPNGRFELKEKVSYIFLVFKK